MKHVRLLQVSFDTEIAAHETPAFRGAIIEKVGIDREHYHNHNNDPGAKVAYHYRYPLVQYKRQRRRPAILFIDEGVDEAQYFFSQQDWALDFAGRHYQASVAEFKAKQYKVGVCEEPKYYTLRRWAALNQKNFEEFKELEGLADQVRFLEQKLVGHILGFAKGVGHRFSRRFELAIVDIMGRRFAPFEGVHMLTFDVRFKANVLLPAQVGLGRGVSQGFGTLYYWNPKKENEKQ